MIINKDKCTECRLCIEACPVGAVAYRNSEMVISDDCVNTLQCTAQQACPEDAIERSERAKDTIMCTICPVGCQIKIGKVGECRMYTNRNGQIDRTVSLTPFESVKEIVGEEYDEVIRQPLLTGIGAGFRMTMAPLIVQEKVRGVDVVTCVSECHFEYCGILIKLDCEEYIGEEGAEIHYNGEKVGVVTQELYGSKTITIGGVNEIIRENGWMVAKLCAAIANREKVKLKVKGGARLELRVGEKPVVNGQVSEKKRLVCGVSTASYLYNDFMAGLVDEVIVIDRHITGQFGAFDEEKTRHGALTGEDEKKTRWGRLTKSGIRLRGASPIGLIKFPEPGGPGWGMTQMQSPLDIIENFDPAKLSPGFKLLITETNGDRTALFIFTNEGTFEEAEIPVEIKKAMEEYKACCEPARVSAYLMPCPSGTARHKFVTPRHNLRLHQAIDEKKVCVTMGGAPTWLLAGGGATLMVDVERVKAGAFHWTNHPAVVAPLEWTIKLEDFIGVGGAIDRVQPLKEVMEESGEDTEG